MCAQKFDTKPGSSRMDRREFLHVAGAGLIAGLLGCSGARVRSDEGAAVATPIPDITQLQEVPRQTIVDLITKSRRNHALPKNGNLIGLYVNMPDGVKLTAYISLVSIIQSQNRGADKQHQVAVNSTGGAKEAGAKVGISEAQVARDIAAGVDPNALHLLAKTFLDAGFSDSVVLQFTPPLLYFYSSGKFFSFNLNGLRVLNGGNLDQVALFFDFDDAVNGSLPYDKKLGYRVGINVVPIDSENGLPRVGAPLFYTNFYTKAGLPTYGEYQKVGR